jgi:YD repeat-containing protein
VTLELTRPSGEKDTLSLDRAGRLLRARDWAGHSTEYRYLGEHLGQILRDGRPWLSIDYDDKGRVREVRHAGETRELLVWNDAGRLASYRRIGPGIVDEGALQLEYGHGALARLRHPKLGVIPAGLAADGGPAVEKDEAAGRTTLTLRRGNARARLALDRRSATATTFTGATTRQAFDDAGRLASLVDPAGQTTTYRYDAAGALARIDLPGGACIRYDRDGAWLKVVETWSGCAR